MALADYNLRYELPFKDVDGNQWRVRIYDRDEAGSVERLWGTGNPVSIYYEGDEDLSSGIIGSSCTIRVYGRPDTAGTSDLSQFFVSDEERFYVKVEYAPDGSTYSTYWTGFLHQDEYTEYITSDPYEVELVALDRLGTIKSTMNEDGYSPDDNPTLISLVQNFVDKTKLELTITEATGISTENGNVTSFLTDQTISAETFLLEDNFVEMASASDVISSLALSLNCRVWQQEGKLYFSSMFTRWLEGAGGSWLSVPSDILSVEDNLSARHRSSKRFTNISIGIGSKNILSNASFETDSVGDTTPTSWSKPVANTSATISVSDESVAEGSYKSLKTVNNRISDSTFDAASTADKNGVYCLFETTSENISLTGGVVPDELAGVIDFSFFIDNVLAVSPYELRFSMSREDSGGTELFYNWENRGWSTNFNYSFFDAETSGEWENLAINFSISGYWFGSANTPIKLRFYTMNYHQSLSDVQVYYDNFSIRLYNAFSTVSTSLSPKDQYLNLSTDQNTDVKTDSINLDLLFGVTNVDTGLENVLSNGLQQLDGKVLGQYVNSSTGVPEDVFFKDNIIDTFIPLPTELMRLRTLLDSTSKKVYSGVFATKRVDDNSWTPIFFGDKFTIAYSAYTDSKVNLFTRFGVELKDNRYSIDAINLP